MAHFLKDHICDLCFLFFISFSSTEYNRINIILRFLWYFFSYNFLKLLNFRKRKKCRKKDGEGNKQVIIAKTLI